MWVHDSDTTATTGAADMIARTTPFSIRVAGLLCIATGVNSILGMVAQIANGKFLLDFGFVFLVLGWGLMAGRPTSRRWLLFLFGSGAILFTILAIWMTWEYFMSSSPHDAATFYNGIADVAYTGCLATFVVATLIRADIRSWFEIPRTEPAPGASWTLPAAVAFAIVLGQQTLHEGRTKASAERAFPIFTTVAFRDAETGERIDSISYRTNEAVRPSGDPFSTSLRVSISSSADEGVGVALKGIAIEPVEVTFTAEGYTPKVVRLTESSPEMMTLELKRKP